MPESPVVFQELPAGARKLGLVTLSVAATLNSLTLEMVDLLQAQLDAWSTDDSRDQWCGIGVERVIHAIFTGKEGLGVFAGAARLIDCRLVQGLNVAAGTKRFFP